MYVCGWYQDFAAQQQQQQQQKENMLVDALFPLTIDTEMTTTNTESPTDHLLYKDSGADPDQSSADGGGSGGGGGGGGDLDDPMLLAAALYPGAGATATTNTAGAGMHVAPTRITAGVGLASPAAVAMHGMTATGISSRATTATTTGISAIPISASSAGSSAASFLRRNHTLDFVVGTPDGSGSPASPALGMSMPVGFHHGFHPVGGGNGAGVGGGNNAGGVGIGGGGFMSQSFPGSVSVSVPHSLGNNSMESTSSVLMDMYMMDDPDELARHASALEKRRKRRESHNAVERRRRDNINDRIQELSILVPDSIDIGGGGGGGGSSTGGTRTPMEDSVAYSATANRATSSSNNSSANANTNATNANANKGIILKKTTEYIRRLQSHNQDLVGRIQELEAKLAQQQQQQSSSPSSATAPPS